MSVHEDDTVAQLAIAAPSGQPPCFFKLPNFWTASPTAWFGVAEAQFLLRGTALLSSLLSFQRNPPAGLPTSLLPLVTTVTTTSGPLSWWLPSSLPSRRPRSSSPQSHWGTAAPLSFSPRCWSLYTLVRSSPVSSPMLFLLCLPAAVCLQLNEDNCEYVRTLADKADRCTASIQCHQQLLPVFAATADNCKDNEEQSDYSVATVGSSRGGCFSQQSRSGQNCPKGSIGPGSAAAHWSRSPARPS